jgi:hypothetical protein
MGPVSKNSLVSFEIGVDRQRMAYNKNTFRLFPNSFENKIGSELHTNF